MSERFKQQIREAADFLVRLLTVPVEPEPEQQGQQDDTSRPTTKPTTMAPIPSKAPAMMHDRSSVISLPSKQAWP